MFRQWLINRRLNRILRDMDKHIPQGRTVAQLYPFLLMLDAKLAVGLNIAVHPDEEEDEAQDLKEASLGGIPDDYIHMLN